jgi:hypothetical protein
MQKSIIVSLLISLHMLVSCTNGTSGSKISTPIQGEKVNLGAPAYRKMCIRDYDPALCPQEFQNGS